MASNQSSQYGIGAISGVVTFLVGYVVTFLWQSQAVEESLQNYNTIVDFFGGNPIPTWKAIGWLYYNAHAVPFTTPAFGGGRASQNMIADGNAPMLLYIVPPLLLIIGGFIVARSLDKRKAETGARVGVGVVAGYLLAALVGLVVFRHASSSGVIHVQYALGALVAGVVYPVVFGAIGGALAGITR